MRPARGVIQSPLGLQAVGEESFRGFGVKDRFQSELVSGVTELAGRRQKVTFASISDADFPVVAPKIVLGRNLLNLLKITLDGPSKNIVIEWSR